MPMAGAYGCSAAAASSAAGWYLSPRCAARATGSAPAVHPALGSESELPAMAGTKAAANCGPTLPCAAPALAAPSQRPPTL